MDDSSQPSRVRNRSQNGNDSNSLMMRDNDKENDKVSQE